MIKKLSTLYSPDSLLSLQSDYVAHLKILIADIAQLRQALATRTAQEENGARLYTLIHKLCGSGATFGFPDITEAGQPVHLLLKPLMAPEGGDWDSILHCRPFLDALDRFEQVCARTISSHVQERGEVIAQQETPAAQPLSRRVCILRAEGQADDGLDDQLRHFGYAVTVVTSALALPGAMEQQKPDVLMVYISSPAEETLALAALEASPTRTPQLIVVSPRGDFEARLAAVRAGAMGYFTLPVDVIAAIDKIEQLLARTGAAQSYHVMIVDDDEMLMKFYSHALMQAGILTTSVSSPKEALEVLAHQSVDLVLIDYLMPHCNGRELATIIRQHEKYVSLPIIFMSGREDVESLLIDTGLGIDDYLVKPITGDQLATVVRSRARRSSELQALMARDSFTGLLNHGHFMDMLEMELGQAQRYRKHGAYALIDIDEFKQVNDTYGHIAGDHVIKGLARLLQQRLRRSDIIGRCGGEEFGIIMPDCDLENARQIVETLREQFAELCYRLDGQDIRATFSAGLTTLQGHEHVDGLIRRADAALYEAKKTGRNRLVVA